MVVHGASRLQSRWGIRADDCRVGPLARLNVARFAGRRAGTREMHEFKQRGEGRGLAELPTITWRG